MLKLLGFYLIIWIRLLVELKKVIFQLCINVHYLKAFTTSSMNLLLLYSDQKAADHLPPTEFCVPTARFLI